MITSEEIHQSTTEISNGITSAQKTSKGKVYNTREESRMEEKIKDGEITTTGDNNSSREETTTGQEMIPHQI
ncbi:hypothetical protein GE061_020043 [Apolygus lucorum]|uniref:Uncharacterized protein n=1 Tax=Apolygus lucorum TaxID=248454 RepID=A0A8S9XBD0_APOLU|nr:hypothetical protein GE061_020043 [Apolygus lucorum]